MKRILSILLAGAMLIGLFLPIRLMIFDVNGVVKTMNPTETYAEFAANGGYLIAPEGAVAVNIPAQNRNDGNMIDHSGITYSAGSAEYPDFASFEGKKLSILGASISTYTGVSDDSESNSTIGSNAVYYTEGKHGVYLNDTWWMQAANDLDMRLLVNNSWSGSSLLYERNGTVGAYVDRCVQLHNNDGEEPDVIAIQMGTNDFQYYKDTLGTADIDYDALITSNGDGTYIYTAPTTSLEAAAIVLHKISVRYPNAEVYYLNISQRVDGTDDLIRSFNAELKQVVEHFGAHIVDIYNSGITEDNFDKYIGDNRVHPNKLGMDAYTEAFKKALLSDTEQNVRTHQVSFNLKNTDVDYGVNKTVVSGDSFSCVLTPDSGYDLNVSVMMGGEDITSKSYASGIVSIDSVTADVVINASGVKREAQEFRWEFDGTDLVSVGGNNALTKNEGTVTDGVFSNTRYSLEKSVQLFHNMPWVVEWKCEGTWVNSGSSSGGRVFSSTDVNSEYNARYIFKSNNNGIIAMGEKTSSGSHNYGLALADYGIDWTQEHTYRLENRIAADSSNMVWLYVDGSEIGPLNHYYVGTEDQNSTSDWISGKDFVFPYMGTDTHGFTNCSIEYIRVLENGGLSAPISLRYDDRYDVSGKVVEIIDAGTPTSYKVGYGVAAGTLDDAVITLDGDTLVATGIGTAYVDIDGIVYEVTVNAAPISLILLAGQSNMQGSEGNADQSIVCSDGMVYSTYGDRYTMTVENATSFAPSALTGSGSAINVNGNTTNLENWPVYLLNEAGAGKAGPDSGYAWEWIKQTGEKVWIVNAAHGGSSITTWQKDGSNYEEAVALFSACQETLSQEIAAGHYTLSHMGYFWCQGCTDETQTAEWYVNKFLSMHNSLKADLALDIDGDGVLDELEFANITVTLAGHVNKTGYRYEDGVYDSADSAFFMTYEELEMRGQRVAQYWLAANPEYPEINMVCNVGESWVEMPDGTDGVAEYFASHYENGKVDYTTQVAQKESWYSPQTPSSVKDSIHYNQIGYNEVGIIASRNTLILLGEIEDTTEKTTVRFVDWTGYRELSSVAASAEGKALVVPIVSPCYRAKDVTYQVSDGLNYLYYDLGANSAGATGEIRAIGAEGSVIVEAGHIWSQWELVCKPSAEGPGTQKRFCSDCGKVETRELDGVWQTHKLSEHMAALPEKYCSGTNLWAVTEHDKYYFASGTNWGIHGSGSVCSVTISVSEGEKIFATSFGAYGENGNGVNTSSGIRVTFFGEYGVIKSMIPAETYAEFTANGGYLIAPEGAVAVNIPMWNNSDDNEIYLLDRAHNYSGITCSVCGTEHPALANFEGKVVSILGDSISTFAGYIPTADGFNREHLPRYPQDNLLTDVNETWWMQVISGLNAKLGINDSWRGATLCGAAAATTGDTGENAALSNLIRIQNLGSNGTPDVILLYGGTNDLAHISNIGSFDPSKAPAEADLITKKWNNLADGFLHTVLRIRYYYPDAELVVLLPTYTSSYYTDEKLAQGNALMAAICEYYGVTYLDLRDSGVTAKHLPDGIHPGAEGMDLITESVLEVLLNECEVEAGENVVYSVNHVLNGAKSSLSYYKGVSANKPFVTAVTGEDLSVAVTMGGADITSSVYADGLISIPEVTGDIVITVQGRIKPVYEDHLQELPEKVCSGTDIWKQSEHDTEYYTVDGWGVHPSGQVRSVTLPINAGDRLCATSFGKSGTNGGSMNGIRVTFFDANGVIKSMAPDQTYAEFTANGGYLIAPEGAVAVNIPMWTAGDENEIYLLDRAHNYSADITFPTGTKPGYTKYTCSSCGDSYRTEWLDKNAYSGKTIACIGDSITAAVGVTKDVNDYVKLLADELGMNYIRLGVSGTTLCTDGSRTCNIGKLTESNLSGADVVTIAMGINDFCAAGKGYYELGDINSTDSSTIYGAMRMWCERIVELKKTDALSDTQFYFLTPVITSWNNSVTSARDWDQSKTNVHGYTLRDLCNAIIEVAALYDLPVIDVNLLSGLYYNSAEDNTVTEFGGDGVHPGAKGHEMMAAAMADVILQNNLRNDHEHSFGSWVTTTWPFCRVGEEQRVCSVCSATECRSLDARHNYSAVITPPTCTEKGYTTHTCAGCGASYTDNHTDALGHNYQNDVCTECGAVRPETTDWSDASVVFVGDSITYGTGTEKAYHSFIDEMGVFASVQAMGIAGSCISSQSDYGSGNSPLISRYTSIPDADLIVIFMGTNDYGHETPLGSSADTTDVSFYGALNMIISGIQAQHPNSQLVFVTPLHRYGFGTSQILGTKFTYDHIANGRGHTLADYVNAIKVVCEKYSLPVVDLFNEYPVDPSDSADKAAYMPDGLHPNADGHEILADLIFRKLQNIPRKNSGGSDTEDVLLQHGNKFVSDYANDATRASSISNLYLSKGQTVTFKLSGEYEWALAKTDSAYSTGYSRYYPENGWNSAESYIVAEDGYYGLVLKKRDGNTFDFENRDSNRVFDYISVDNPDEHQHSYTATVTPPTCTEKGYTTHTCAGCGATYTSDHTKALGHSYAGNICIRCGRVDPNAPECPEDSIAALWPLLNTDLTHIVCYGQSFSVGADAPIFPDPVVDGVYVFGSITDSSQGNSLSPLASTGNQHPIISAGNVLAQLLAQAGYDTDIILGSYGSGGRTIAQLMSEERQAQIKHEEGYTYDCLSSGRYTVFENSVNAIAQYAATNGQSVSCPVIVYLQGETDQNTDAQLGYPENPSRAGYGAGGDKEKYKEYMMRLKEDMQRQVMEVYGQTEKPLFIIYQVSGTYTRTEYSSINMAQIEFAQENADVILVQTPYFAPHYTVSHHLTTNGYRWLGEYVGRYIYTALVEREKPWPMLPESFTIEEGNVVRIAVAGAQNGLSIDTYTVENATNSGNLYGFNLVVDSTIIVPASVTVSGNDILLIMPEGIDLRAADSVYVYYAGKSAKGTGNIRDNCADQGFYEYLDDSNDTGTGNNQGISHSALDTNGNSLIGKKYPLYNWLASFCYELPVERKQSVFYHWELSGTDLVSVTGASQNDLTLLQGSIENGVLMNVQYQMSETVVLYHDYPWAIEWKTAGNGSNFGGGMLLAAADGSGSKAGALYLPADSRGFVAWNVSSESRNYGIKLADFGIDTRQEHIYRIENRIAADGTNTLYLIVDGIEIGDMNTAYSTKDGSKIEATTSWINGHNIYLSFMGKPTNFLLKNMKLTYLKIWENTCNHFYSATVTPPTCTEKGYTTHTCTGCGASYTDTHTDALGHKYESVVTPPTCTEKGYTTHICECGESYVDGYVDARGYDWMLEDGEFKILLIGNSFSEDASNAGMPNSQMLDILQAMLGDDIKITVGLCYSGGKGLNWHATQSEQGNKSYSLRVISTESGKWKSLGSYTSADALEWTDWDVVSLQHYEINTTTGKESNAYPAQVDPKFDDLEAATEFMLDYVDSYAPQAAVYFYMHWARAYKSNLNESLATYNKMAEFFPVVMHYRGSESGRRFETIIPVGLSVQNARTTYLSLLSYNTTAYADGNLNLTTDAQIGLQRDGGHLSFNIGRYIAALTFAEMIIPEQMRTEGYILPDIRITESVGKLPKEYTEIAQKAVMAAVTGWKNGSLAVTNISGYEKAPTSTAGDVLRGSILDLTCSENPADLTAKIGNAVLAALPEDFAVDAVSVTGDASFGESFSCEVTIRFGYTSLKVPVNCIVSVHNYSSTVTPPTCTEQGYTTHTCACGESYVDGYTDAKGHDLGQWTVVKQPTCTEKGREERTCSRCDHYETREVAAKGHSYTSVVTVPTCTEKGYTNHTCACGDSYVDSYTDAKGHSYVDMTCTVCGYSYVINVTVVPENPIPYTLDGRTVTIAHGKACKVGYLIDGSYVAIEADVNDGVSYSFIIPEGVPEILIGISGDINSNGKINSADIVFISRALLNHDHPFYLELSATQIFFADVDNDGLLTSDDVDILDFAIVSEESPMYRPIPW